MHKPDKPKCNLVINYFNERELAEHASTRRCTVHTMNPLLLLFHLSITLFPPKNLTTSQQCLSLACPSLSFSSSLSPPSLCAVNHFSSFWTPSLSSSSVVFFYVPPRNYSLKFDHVLSPPTMKWDLRPCVWGAEVVNTQMRLFVCVCLCVCVCVQAGKTSRLLIRLLMTPLTMKGLHTVPYQTRGNRVSDSQSRCVCVLVCVCESPLILKCNFWWHLMGCGAHIVIQSISMTQQAQKGGSCVTGGDFCWVCAASRQS